MKQLALVAALAVSLLFTQPAEAGRWQQKHIQVLNCTSGNWTAAVTEMVRQWNACKVVSLSVVSGECPADGTVVSGKVVLYSPDCSDYIGLTHTSSSTTIVWAYATVCERTVYGYSALERQYVIGHEMGHAIAVLPHVLGVTSSIMSPSIVNPLVTVSDCNTLKKEYQGH